MSAILDKIVADREKYVCSVKTLGACKLPSPVRHRKYVADGERVFATESESAARFAETKLGHLPTFEKAGPKERIFHDPRWTRVGIVTAGGLCPGLNTVIKGLVEILEFDYGVKSVFGIDKCCNSAFLLTFCNNVLCKSSFTTGFRSVYFYYSSSWNSANTKCYIK